MWRVNGSCREDSMFALPSHFDSYRTKFQRKLRVPMKVVIVSKQSRGREIISPRVNRGKHDVQ